MIRINLLPHRVAFRQQQIIEHLIVLMAGIFLTVAVIFSIDAYSSADLTELQNERQSLQTQNQDLAKKIGELKNLDALRQEVEGKLQIVDELQAGRFKTLNTLLALNEALPSNVWVGSIKDDADKLSVSGFGESSKAVANFMRGIQANTLFDDVKLVLDQAALDDGAAVRKFQLSFKRLSLAEQQAKEKASAAGEKL